MRPWNLLVTQVAVSSGLKAMPFLVAAIQSPPARGMIAVAGWSAWKVWQALPGSWARKALLPSQPTQ